MAEFFVKGAAHLTMFDCIAANDGIIRSEVLRMMKIPELTLNYILDECYH